MNRLITHVRSNAIAYVALFFAIGGGGAGAAIAATAITSTTIHGCVNKATGALFVAKRCSSSERALSFNQRGPAGPAGPAASLPYGQVNDRGQVTAEKGMTIVATSTGVYTVTITASSCKTSSDQIPVITAVGLGAAPGSAGSQNVEGNVQPAVNEASTDGPRSFSISAGYIQGGNFVPTDQGFDVFDECGSLSS